jgi:amino acid adenylation domain-containing protein
MNRLLQHWVREQASRQPEAVAIVAPDGILRYGELEAHTNRLARLLKAAGCKKGDRICFAIPKSPAAIVAILGVLKADCMHVPVDTACPAQRAARILASSEPRCVLGTRAVANFLEDVFALTTLRDSACIGWMDDWVHDEARFRSAFSWKDLQAYSGEPLDFENDATDPAHILFTSGSTGDPKGVVITHDNVRRFVDWALKYFDIHESDRISCHPPLHFDLSYFDIFGAFAAGAQLHLVPPEQSLFPNKLAEFIRTSAVTQWFSVPSVLNYMAKFDVVQFDDFPQLKRLLWCGEVFPTSGLIYWMKRLPKVRFTNLYGPTETTIASSYYSVPACPTDAQASVPIGSACEGEELLVLNEELQPVPSGEIGQLYIRGVGLSPGYWRDTKLTAAAFLPYGPGEYNRIYRTGDLARIGDDGLVYFVGRTDSQIKSRGYRIELGEIEAALSTLENVRECAVVAIPSDSFEGNLICCAYVIADGCQTTNTALRSKLSKLVPSYMLPARWMCLSGLPQNANGKINRPRLRELFAEQESLAVSKATA